MKIMFIDESTKQENRNNKYFFIQLGIMINKESILPLEEDLRKIKDKYQMTNFKSLRKNKKEEKIECTSEICKTLLNHNASVLSTVLGAVALKDINNISDSYFGAITFLIERFFMNLKNESRTGLIIHDSLERSLELNLRKKVHQYVLEEELLLHGKSKGRYKDRIYPAILFSDDAYSEILQVSDLISLSLHSAIFKCLKSGEGLVVENLPKYNGFLKLYWPLFIKDPRNAKAEGWGVKIWW